MTDPESPPPRRRTAVLPTFHQPSDPAPPATTDPPTPWDLVNQVEFRDPPDDGSDDGSPPRDLPIPKPARDATRTGISATSDVDPKLLIGLVAAVVGIVVTAAAAVVKRTKPGRELRKPADKQVRDFADPLTKILLAHVEITRLHPSLVHGVKAAGVLGQYVEEGPLTVAARATAESAGIPADIQEPQS